MARARCATHWSQRRDLPYKCRMTPDRPSHRATRRRTRRGPIIDPLIPDPTDYGRHYPTRPGEMQAELPLVYARHSCGCQCWWTVPRRPEETQGQRLLRMGRIYQRLAGRLCRDCARVLAMARPGR